MTHLSPQAAALAAQLPLAPDHLVTLALEHAEGMVGGSLIMWFLKHLVNTSLNGAHSVGPLAPEQVAQLRSFLVERLEPARTEAQADEIAMALLRAVGIHPE
jgi:hypothetical protein